MPARVDKIEQGFHLIVIFLAFIIPVFGSDVHFAAGKSSLGIPFELENNLIFVRVSVNGSRPLRFAVDSGASVNVLDLQNAKVFDLSLQPIGKAGGIGAQNNEAFALTDKVSIGLPGVVLSDQSMAAISLNLASQCFDQITDAGTDKNNSPTQKETTKVVFDGVLGKGFWDSFVVEIDYPSRKLNLYDPKDYEYKGKGENVPLDLALAVAIVQAKIRGQGGRSIKARLIVDTGGGGQIPLTLNNDFADKLGILPPAKTLTPVNECGASGVAEGTSYKGTLKGLQLGNLKLDKPMTFFRKHPTGANYDGIIGGIAFQNLKVIFDYSHRRMILESSRN